MSKECKIKLVDNLEPEYKIKFASLEIDKDRKTKWNRAKGKAEIEKASQDYVDR